MCIRDRTEHFGKAERVVPLFPELVPYLEQAHSRSRSKKGRVFPWVTEETNLRTPIQKILKRAELPAVPRFFQNCRSSRQTELTREFPPHVVCRWLGNSEVIARRHYLKVQESDFAKAAGMHASMQEMAESKEIDGNEKDETNEKTPEKRVSPASSDFPDYTRRDSNPQPSVPKTDALSN